jgi:hypothetical protein
MSSKLRALTGALIVCLIAVPALVRATRTFDPGSRPRLAPSFNKSFDVPPEVADLAPDAGAAPALSVVGPAPRLLVVALAVDSQHVVDPLRGPPAIVRS